MIQLPKKPYALEEIQAFVDTHLQVTGRAREIEPICRRGYADTIHGMPAWTQVVMIESRRRMVLGDRRNLRRQFGLRKSAGGQYDPGNNISMLAYGAFGAGEYLHAFFHEEGHGMDLGLFGAAYWSDKFLTRAISRECRRRFLSVGAAETPLYYGYKPLRRHLRVRDEKKVRVYKPEDYPAEAIAEIFAHYGMLCSELGNEEQVSDILDRAYPDLWPFFRDRIYPDVELKIMSAWRQHEDAAAAIAAPLLEIRGHLGLRADPEQAMREARIVLSADPGRPSFFGDSRQREIYKSRRAKALCDLAGALDMSLPGSPEERYSLLLGELCKGAPGVMEAMSRKSPLYSYAGGGQSGSHLRAYAARFGVHALALAHIEANEMAARANVFDALKGRFEAALPCIFTSGAFPVVQLWEALNRPQYSECSFLGFTGALKEHSRHFPGTISGIQDKLTEIAALSGMDARDAIGYFLNKAVENHYKNDIGDMSFLSVLNSQLPLWLAKARDTRDSACLMDVVVCHIEDRNRKKPEFSDVLEFIETTDPDAFWPDWKPAVKKPGVYHPA